MSSIRMVTTICTRSWTGSPKICSWIAALKSEISAVLAQIGKVVSNRNYFDSCREYMAGQMDPPRGAGGQGGRAGRGGSRPWTLRHMAGLD